MTWLLNLWAGEPVVITGLVDAVLVLLVSFGLHIAPEQVTAIDGLLVAIGILVARSKVSPVTQALGS